MTSVADLEKRVEALETFARSGDPHSFINGERKAKLAEVQQPAKLTNAKIAEISGDDGTDEAENSANKDVAEQLRQERADAKKPAKK